jgi:predicted P-loop ATPase
VWLTEVVPPWDGVPRISRLSHPRYFATEDTPYTRAVGEYVMTAQAGRVLDPGCKADMVPVLVGPQGVRKSSGIAAMSPAEDFFAEFDLEAKDEDKARKMRGCLVGELAELRGLQTRDRESILAWITRRFEEWTPKFKEYTVKLARRCVFWGSTNDDEFLSDPTGERRWLPLMVVGMVDTAAIVRDRLQLWAEAREVYLECGVLYARAERLAKAEHHKFKVVDSWSPRIAAWLDEPWEVDSDETPRTSGRLLADDVLTDCLGLQSAKITKRDQMRVAGILRELGMEKVQKRVPTSRKQGWGRSLGQSRVWTNAGDDEAPRPHRVPTSKR